MNAQPFQFYSTAHFPCSYLPGKVARNCVIDTSFAMDSEVYSELIKYGFRRSGTQVYRPQCTPCKECISTRIPVDTFSRSRSQKRNWKNNQDLTVAVNNSGFKKEYADLYESYIKGRHGTTQTDGVEHFFESQWCNTEYLEFYAGSQLLAVAVIDVLEYELSAVYTLFDPTLGSKRGLGTYAILWEIEYTKQLGKQYLYPGYWISESAKMNYKSKFKPIEGYKDGYWTDIL